MIAYVLDLVNKNVTIFVDSSKQFKISCTLHQNDMIIVLRLDEHLRKRIQIYQIASRYAFIPIFNCNCILI